MGIPGLVVVLCLLTGVVASMAAVYNVMAFGAAGDGQTDDSNSFVEAWNMACADAGTPTYLIPSGMTFLLGLIDFMGSCRGNVHVQLLGNLVAPGDGMLWNPKGYWIRFKSVHGLTVDGNGVIDGRGAAWWDCRRAGKCRGPLRSMIFESCDNLQVRGLHFMDGSSIHLAVSQSTTVDISNIAVTTPQNIPNTDGIHIEKSHHVRITDCRIGTGDDCISIGPGTSDLNISWIACGPGHGISIGSLGEAGSRGAVEGVRVSHCGFNGSTNGVRIKTWQGGSGYVRGVVFEHIEFSAVQNPIMIDQYYCNKAHTCPNKTKAVQVSDITYASARGWGVRREVITFACSMTVPCTGIVVSDVNIASADRRGATSHCLNAHGTVQGPVHPPIPCLQQESV